MTGTTRGIVQLGSSSLRAGDWVQVRSKEEILSTLDGQGRLDGLPFMPEMLAYSGQRFRVMARAHKTCDTVNSPSQGRGMSSAVHLDELRCDGAGHGGCDAACLIFWKDAWLRPVDGPGAPAAAAASTGSESAPYSEHDLQRDTVAPGSDPKEPQYVCQATLLPQATSPLPWWDVRQYLEDFVSGNVGLFQLLRGGIYTSVYNLIKRSSRFSARASFLAMRLYDRWQRLVGGVPYPRRRGTIPLGQKTPSPEPLNLKEGELVRVKEYPEILATLNVENKNRGLLFDAEEVPYCGGVYRVRSIVRQLIDERTGKMRTLKGNNVILENVWCKGHYSYRRMFCPRAIFSIWREAWLERVDASAVPAEGAGPGTR
jgi:hypothetical protein